jgi:hypothetical protein
MICQGVPGRASIVLEKKSAIGGEIFYNAPPSRIYRKNHYKNYSPGAPGNADDILERKSALLAEIFDNAPQPRTYRKNAYKN